MRRARGRALGATTLAALLLIIIGVALAVTLYVLVLGLAGKEASQPLALKALARIENVVYNESDGKPVLILYIRNLGPIPLTPDKVYVEGSPVIVGHPKKYKLTTRIEAVRLSGAVEGTAAPTPASKQVIVEYWEEVAGEIKLKDVWGGDEWEIDVASGSAQRTDQGYVTDGTKLEWRLVRYNAEGDNSASGYQVTIWCRSRSGWGAASLRAELDSPLYPPFVVEAKVLKSSSDRWDTKTNVAVYLTSRARSDNPYYDYPFYEAGVFKWYADVVELRARNQAGNSKYFSTDVVADQHGVRLALVVEDYGVGEIHGYLSDDEYGSTAFRVTGMNGDRPIKYVWLTVETTDERNYKYGVFWLDQLKIYKRPYFTITVRGLGGTVKLYNLSLRVRGPGGEAEVFYVKDSSDTRVVVDPRDFPDLYLVWLRGGYPLDVAVRVSVLNASKVVVKPVVEYRVELSSIEVKVIDPPEDFDPSKLSVRLENPRLRVEEWSVSRVEVSGGKLRVEVSAVVSTVDLDVVVLYGGEEISRRSFSVPVYDEFRGEKTVEYSGGDVEVEVPISVDAVYGGNVLVDASVGEAASAGVGEDSKSMSLGSATTQALAWRSHEAVVDLSDVYGGDTYRIRWNGGWTVDRIDWGKVLREEFDSGWKKRWDLKRYKVYADEYERMYDGDAWGGVEARRSDDITMYPSASLVRRFTAESTVLVVEGSMRKYNDYRDNYMTGVFLADREYADPWGAPNWVMCRLYKSPYGESIQVGVKKSGKARWSHKVYGYYREASFVMVVEGGTLEYWVWPSTSRSGRPYHGVLTGAPSLEEGYVHLSHTYYQRRGSTKYYRYSLFDDITVYKGTKVVFRYEGSDRDRVERVVFMDSSGRELYEWRPSGREDSVVLDLESWYLRDYWLRSGCPLKLKVRIEGRAAKPVSVDVNVKLDLRVRVFATFTLEGYDPELLRSALRIEAYIQDVDASVVSVSAASVGESDYVKASATVRVDEVKVKVVAYLKGEKVYEDVVTISGGEYSAVNATKAEGDSVSIDVVVPAYLEKDVTAELSGGQGPPVIEVGGKEALKIMPEEVKHVEFELEEKLVRGHEYLVRVVFLEGVEARRWFTP